jgi:hypothetical protein
MEKRQIRTVKAEDYGIFTPEQTDESPNFYERNREYFRGILNQDVPSTQRALNVDENVDETDYSDMPDLEAVPDF